MSYTTVLGITPDQRPYGIIELRVAHGWSPNIWQRLLDHIYGNAERSWIGRDDELNDLWKSIDTLPEWQQCPLALTFDTGVIPAVAYPWAAEMLDEFEGKLPARDGWPNHVPAVANVFRSAPAYPYVGTWGTSVSWNPFDPWDEQADDYGGGLPECKLYLLPQHRAQP